MDDDPCPYCDGEGHHEGYVCPTCGGSGTASLCPDCGTRPEGHPLDRMTGHPLGCTIQHGCVCGSGTTPTVTDAEVDAAICAAAEHDGFNPNGLTLDGPESEKTRKMLEAAARARPAPTVTDAAQEAAQAAGRAYGWDEGITPEEYADAILDIIQVAARARQENHDGSR